MREVQGLVFDPESGMAYVRNEETNVLTATGFTFENASSGSWWPPFVRFLAFQDYATEATARNILAWAREHFPHVTFRINGVPPSGWFPPSHPMRMIHASTTSNGEMFNAGRIASTIARRGSKAAAESFAAELKQARIT